MITFPEGKFKEVVDTLEKNGYVVENGIGTTFSIYPKELEDSNFTPIPPHDEWISLIRNAKTISFRRNEKGESEIGYITESTIYACIDMEKNQVDFIPGEQPATQEHHEAIKGILSPYSSN